MIKPIREIRDREGNLHFRRWRLLNTPYFDVNLHHILKSDRDPHVHSHPWRWATLVLKGGYVSQVLTKDNKKVYDRLTMFSFRKGMPSTFHRLRLTKPVWTLFFTGKKRWPWGYWVDNDFIKHEEYRERKNSGLLNKETLSG